MSDQLDPSSAMILGEVRGQLREIIHTMNNERAKQEALAKTLGRLEGMPDQLKAIEGRLEALEVERHRRDGATGVIATLLKSPAIGWLVGAAVAVWAFIGGKTS